MNDLSILYEDNHIIVVLKPYNILSQKDETDDIDMLTLVKQYIKTKYCKPGNVYLGLVHRLDRPVGGIMVFAKTSKAASRLSEMVRNHTIQKEYLAVVHGILPDKHGTFIDFIERKKEKSYITDSLHGKESILHYEVLEECKDENLSLVRVQLVTGRHHQIRLQFATRGYELYGDMKYGKKERGNLALYAYRLTFEHPVKHQILTFTSYPPKKNIWQLFTFVN